MPPAGLASSTLTVMIGRALGLAAAFGSFIVMAGAYGTTVETDIFFCAYAVPYAVLVIVGATLSQSFVPLHAKVAATEGEDAARRLSSACINLTFLAMLVLAGVLMLLVPWLARWAARGLSGTEVGDVRRQMLWLMPLVVFGGAASLVKGVLNAR